jgi:hypothetical protein
MSKPNSPLTTDSNRYVSDPYIQVKFRKSIPTLGLYLKFDIHRDYTGFRFNHGFTVLYTQHGEFTKVKGSKSLINSQKSMILKFVYTRYSL